MSFMKFWRASFQMFYTMFQHQTQTKYRVRCFNIKLAENKQNKENINDRKVKGIVGLLTQFGATHLHLGATKPGRKSTSIVLILSY